MSIIFNVSGTLNISQDASDLPEQSDQFNIQSGAMVRCKNLRIDQKGIAKTRDGSSKVSSSALSTPVWWIEEQALIRYAFAGTHIYRNEVSIASGLTSAQWSAIKYNPYNSTTQSIYALNGTDRKRIEGSTVYEWGIEAPTIGPILSVGSATGLTGTYNAKYTYVRKEGSVVVSESNPSPAGNATAVANQKLLVSITEPTDPQVTHVRLYRTSAGGVVYNFDQDIAVGVGGFTSTQADAALGDLVETDHDRPPLGSYVAGPAYDGTCFIIKDNLLYYCKPKQPEYWPADYYIEVSVPQFEGQVLVFHNGQPFFITPTDIFYIQGTGQGTFLPLPMKAKTGAQSVYGAVSLAGKGIFHTGTDGIYLYSSGIDTKLTEETLEPLFRGEDTQGMPGVFSMDFSWLFIHGNNLYFGYVSSADIDSSIYGASNVLVLNLETNRVSFYKYNDGANVQITSIAQSRNFGNGFLVGDRDGYIRIVENKDFTEDESEPIAWEVQSKDFILATRKHFPRWVKYDVDASDADSCQGEYILSGSTLHTHTITGNRDTRRRLVEVDNGNRASIRISGTGPAAVYGVEAE